jgi:hypothetical protein
VTRYGIPWQAGDFEILDEQTGKVIT